MGQGWLESDDDYQQRMSREANEQRIEQSTGEPPKQGWLESDEGYRSRISDEASIATISDFTGENPSQGWLEGDSAFRERLGREAREAIVEDATGEVPSQGWFESDDRFDSRIRHEANEAAVGQNSGEKPKQGLLESDKEFRQRISLEARERIANSSKAPHEPESYPDYRAPDVERTIGGHKILARSYEIAPEKLIQENLQNRQENFAKKWSIIITLLVYSYTIFSNFKVSVVEGVLSAFMSPIIIGPLGFVLYFIILMFSGSFVRD